MPSALLRDVGFSADQIRFKRCISYLDDGSVVAALYDWNTDECFFYHSTDRSTWTLKGTISNLSPISTPALGLSMTIDGSNNLHFVWTADEATSNSVCYYKTFNYDGGYAWTAVANELVVTAANGVSYTLCDIAITDSGWPSVILRESDLNFTPIKNVIRVLNKTSTGWSSYVPLESQPTSGTHSPYSGYVTICQDPRGAASGYHNMVISASTGDSVSTTGVNRSFRVNETNGNRETVQSFLNTAPEIFSGDHGVLLPINGDGVGDVNHWTWVLVYTSYGANGLNYMTFRLNHADGSSDSNSSKGTPVGWGATYGRDTALAAVTKGAAGNFITDGRVAAVRRTLNPVTGTGVMLSKVLPIHFPFHWSPEHNWGDGYSGTHYTYISSGATRNLPATVIDSIGLSGAGVFRFFTSGDGPGVPTSVKPTGTVITSTPTLEAVLGAPELPRGLSIGEWRVADDAAFTVNVKNIVEPWVDLRAHTTAFVKEVVPTAQRIPQGIKYLQARTVDVLGVKSAWTAHQFLPVDHPPTTHGHSPSQSQAWEYDPAGVDFHWAFSDTSSTDTQTAYEVEISRNVDGSVVVGTGKITSTTQKHTEVLDLAESNKVLRWRIRVWDTDDVVGDWSNYHLFQMVDAPTVAITSPTHLQVVNTAQPTITWDYTPADSGYPQIAFQVTVKRSSDGVTVYDSGGVISSATTHTPLNPILENLKDYTVKVEVADAARIQASDTHSISTSWIAPDAPDFSVDADVFSDEGFVMVNWTDAIMDSSFISFRLYRTDVITGELERLTEVSNPASSMSYRDWFAKSRRPYRYDVRQVADRFGSAVESDPGGQTVNPVTSFYWLIHPDSPDQESFNMMLRQVIDESFSEEYEQETYHLIGRGRKSDIGDRIGFTGSLTCQVWDVATETARSHRLKLEALKATKREVFLRNPFGDLWKVVAGDIDITRVAGLDHREFHDAVIPYEEVQ